MDYIRCNFFSRGPSSVDIEVTNRCNLKCKMCWFHGERAVGDQYRNSEMKAEEIRGCIDQLATYRPSLYFGGGEPFIRDDFPDILAHAKSLGLPIHFTTNGTLLDGGKIEKITELGIEAIHVSIDGPEELHDRLRGPGTFRKATSNLQSLGKCKKKKALKKPTVTVNITMTSHVIGRLKETVDHIKEATHNGVDCFRIHHLWYVSPGELQAHQKAVYRALGSSAPGAASHCISPPADPRALAEDISALKKMEHMNGFPALAEEEIGLYYTDDYRVLKRCVAPFHAVVVKPNGDMKFCPDEWIDDYVLGNLRLDRFETIWNGRKARHFRSVLFRKKSFPACKRCSWMYSF